MVVTPVICLLYSLLFSSIHAQVEMKLVLPISRPEKSHLLVGKSRGHDIGLQWIEFSVTRIDSPILHFGSILMTLDIAIRILRCDLSLSDWTPAISLRLHATKFASQFLLHVHWQIFLAFAPILVATSGITQCTSRHHHSADKVKMLLA